MQYNGVCVGHVSGNRVKSQINGSNTYLFNCATAVKYCAIAIISLLLCFVAIASAEEATNATPSISEITSLNFLGLIGVIAIILWLPFFVVFLALRNREKWKDYSLAMPTGSVRALLAILASIVGYYFGQRSDGAESRQGKRCRFAEFEAEVSDSLENLEESAGAMIEDRKAPENEKKMNGKKLRDICLTTTISVILVFVMFTAVASAAPPDITSFAPPSPVYDDTCALRTFNVTLDQTVNVNWYLDDSLLFSDVSVTEAKCSLKTYVTGEHNVSAIAANQNGTDMQTWIWNVAGGGGCKAEIHRYWYRDEEEHIEEIHRTVAGYAHDDLGPSFYSNDWDVWHVGSWSDLTADEIAYLDTVTGLSAGIWYYIDLLNQTVAITPFENYSEEIGRVITEEIIYEELDPYTVLFTHIITTTVTYEDHIYQLIVKVEDVTTGAPNITSFAPPSPIYDDRCAWRIFNVTLDQTANVNWYLDDSLLFTNVSVTEAKCSLRAYVPGEHNVSAIATNPNGTDIKTWIWDVGSGCKEIHRYWYRDEEEHIEEIHRTVAGYAHDDLGPSFYSNDWDVWHVGSWSDLTADEIAYLDTVTGLSANIWYYIDLTNQTVSTTPFQDYSEEVGTEVTEEIVYECIDPYTLLVTHIITTTVTYRDVSYPLIVKVEDVTTGAPNITSFAPPSPVNDTVCNWRTFNVTINQTVNVSWYLNNTLQHTNVSTKEASYTLHAVVVGEHNVSAIASNENGTDMQSWVWNVTAAPVLNCTCGDICVNETGWWRDGGAFNPSNTPIQHAIDNATAGDTICVMDGTYNENVDVTKSHLTIRSEKGPLVTTVSAYLYPNKHVFSITDQTDVTLKGFKIRDAHGTSQSVAGIYMNNASECNIFDNVVTNISATGYNYAYGIRLKDSSDNSFDATTVYNISSANRDAEGIHLYHSSDNSFDTSTTVYNISSANRDAEGIHLYHSSDNSFDTSTVYNLSADRHAYGIRLSSSSDNSFDTSTVYNLSANTDANGIYIWDSSDNNSFDTSTVYNLSADRAYGIWLYSSSDNNSFVTSTVFNLSAYYDAYGIWLIYSSDNSFVTSTVFNLSADRYAYGIRLDYSSDNSFVTSTVFNLSAYYYAYGIYLSSSSDNNSFVTSTVFNLSSARSAYGICLISSSDNSFDTSTTVFNLSADGEAYGIRLSSSSDNNSFDTSTVFNLSGDGGAIGIGLISSSDNSFDTSTTVFNLSADGEAYGILLEDSSDNSFDTTTVFNLSSANEYAYGIWLYSSSNKNTFSSGSISDVNAPTWWDFYSEEDAHENSAEDITISSFPTTISFTYDNGIMLKSVATPPADPAGKRNISKYVNVTEVTADSWIFMNVSYEEGDLVGVDENSLRLWKHNGTDWTEVPGTNGVNTAENYVYANITEFSVFAPLGNVTGVKLEINKTGVPDPVSPGGTLNYSISVNNTGNATATNVTVMETYDGNVTFVTAVPAPSPGNDTWKFAMLNVSETRWVNISVIVNTSVLNGTVLHNIVNVTCVEGVTDTDTENTTVFAAPVLNCTCGDICVNETGWWRDGGVFNPSLEPICAAVNSSAAGETICVKDGAYNENVDVNKRLTIRSENGYASTIVNASDSNDHVFEVTANWVNISGFTVQNATYGAWPVYKAGIYLGYGIEHCNISNNNATNNYIGIYLDSSSYNTLTSNTAENNDCGIRLDSSSNNNSLTSNTANENNYYGIKLDSSSNNSLMSNTANENNYYGIKLDSSSNNSLTSNTANENSRYGIWLDSSSNNSLMSNTANENSDGIRLDSSSNHNTLTSNTASNYNHHGIYLRSSSNNTLTSNTANSNNWIGIWLDSSSSNTLTSNTANSNTHHGIGLYDSSNNSLTSNTANENKNDGIGLYNSNNNALTNNTASSNVVGIKLSSNNNNTLTNNNASNNGYGICLYYSSNNNTLTNNNANSNNESGIDLYYSSNNNTLTSNTAENNDCGIRLDSSSNHNSLTSNTASNNNNGIGLYDSSNNSLTSNIANENNWNGIYLGLSSNNNTLTSNTANENNYNHGIMLYDSSNNSLTSNNANENNWDGIYLASSSNNKLTSNTVSNNNEYGIHLYASSSNTLTSNIANENNDYGIYLRSSSNNNTLTNNNANENNDYGICLETLSNNNIIYNNYFNNTNNAWDNGNNIWNTTKTLGTNIIGGQYLGGNYWSDYAGKDINGDGLGDTFLPYNSNGNITNGGDYHPLVPEGSEPLLSIEKSDNPDPVPPGGTLNYSISVNNTGNATATNVTVKETYDENVTFVAAVPAPSPGNDMWKFATLNVSETRWVNISVTVNASVPNGTVLHNIVNVTCDEGVMDSDTEDTTVLSAAVPVLEINKTSNPDPVPAGGMLNYAITVNNTGNATATNVTVMETYDKNVTFVFAVPVPSQGNDTWVLATLNVSETRRINISVIVNASVPNGTVLHNVVNVTCDEGVTDTDTENTTVFVAPALPPNITSFAPPSPVNDTVCNWRTFNVTVDQTVNVSWYLNNTLQHTNVSTKEANYTLHAEAVGEHNVSAIATNENGTDMQTWVWNVTVAPEPVLEITKTDVPDPVSPGGTLNYTIRVNNTGNATAINVIVKETYDANVTFIAAEPAPSSGDDMWQFPTLNVSETRWIKISVSVNASVPNGTVLHNIVNVSCAEGVTGSDTEDTTVFVAPALPPNITSFAPPSPVNDIVCNWRTFNVTVDQTVNVSWYLNNTLQHTNVSTKEANYTLHAEVVGEHNVSAIATNENGTDMQTWVWNVTVAPEPVLEITKTSNPDPVSPGGALNYTIHVNNTGNATAINVIVKETYDANVTFIAAEPAPSSGDDMWQFPTLNVSETRWINISVTVNASVLNGTVLHNIVNVMCDEGVTGSDTEDTTVFVAPALPPNITSFAPPSPVNDIVCNWRTFNVTVDQTVNVSWYLNNTLRHTNVSTKEASYTLHAEVVGEHNVSAIASNGNGMDMQTWVWNVTAAPEPVLEITKTDVPDPVSPFGALNYTIRVNNAGNATAINVIVKETYDANVTFVAAEPAPSSGDDMWQFPTLNVSEMRWINISVTVNASVLNGTVLHNIVNVSCDEGVTDTDTENTTVFVAPVPVLEITKTDAPDPVSHGGTLNYTISVNNTGNGNATNVTVMETYDENVTFVAAEPAPSSGDDMWQFPTLNVSETRWINISVIVNASVLNGTVLHNIVNVSCAEGVSDTDTENTTVFVAPVPVLEIAKTDAPDPVSHGGTLNYTISVNNTGNGNATNVTVMETYDENVTFVAAEPAPSSGDDMWQFPTLNVSETRWINISVIVNASVLNGTVLHNIVNVSCAEGVSDTDTENTTVFAIPSIANVKISKWVKYKTEPESEYRKEIEDARVCNNVSFKIAVQNNGTGTNLTGISVTDVLNCSLGYINDSANIPPTIYENNCPDNQTLLWQFATLWLEPGKYINITFDAHVDECGNDRNYARVDAISGTGCNVSDEDYVYVNCTQATKPKLTKSAPTSVAPGGTITYTILYANVGPVALTEVTITENYPKGVTFISADPAPDAGTNNKWTIGTLPAGTSGQIIIKVKVPDSPDLSFTESGSVTGEGFVMVNKDLSTEQKPYRLKNVVTITCAETDPVTASASTTVSGVPGTSLEITEHGSGIYESEEILNFGTKNKSIRLQKSTEAEYQPTSFNFSDGFSVVFTNMWMQDICSKNMVLGDAMHKKIKYATYIKDDTKTEAGEYGTEMEFASSFQGAAHIGAVSKDVTTSEDYIGEFEIFWAAKEECQYLFNWSRVPGNDSEKLIRFLVDNLAINWAENATITKSDDDRIINISTDWHSAEVILAADNETATVKVGNETVYVLDVRTEDGSLNLNVYDCRLRKISESVTGEGYVMVDKELASGHIQVVEHGSGIYSSDMDFDSQRLNKSTEAEYQPTTFNFSDGFGVNFSSNWMQSICSKDKKAGSAIHKKISDATSIADDTTATKSSMAFETSFNGSIHIGARTEEVAISEDYFGRFNVSQVIKIGDARSTSTSNTSNSSDLPSCP